MVRSVGFDPTYTGLQPAAFTRLAYSPYSVYSSMNILAFLLRFFYFYSAVYAPMHLREQQDTSPPLTRYELCLRLMNSF